MKCVPVNAALCAMVLCSGATASSKPAQAHHEFVRKVDFSKAPEMEDLIGHARQFGNEMYPKICALLSDDAALRPPRFDIVLGPLKSRNTGETHLDSKRIYINSAYLTNSATRQEMFDKVFVHEMAHMTQKNHKTRLFFWNARAATPAYWEEGVADYVRYKLLGTNGWDCPQCDARFPHYTSGYTCAGAFLLYVEATCGPNVVRQLNARLRRDSYSDAFFVNTTGKSLEVLWAEFQMTPAFKPRAAEAYQLQQELGFVNGQPPKDVEARFNKFVDQHADALTRHAVTSANANGKPVEDIHSRIAVYLYYTQPKGTPEKFLSNLRDEGKLPGFTKAEKGRLSGMLTFEDMESMAYPASRTFVCAKKDDPSGYHYIVSRAYQESDWKLEKAWRTSSDGDIVEEYLVK